VPESGQRLHSARRVGSGALEHGDRRLRARGVARSGLPEDAVQVVETADRAAVGQLLSMNEYVDIIVPRAART